MSETLDLGDLDRFTVGTVGQVGRRVFLLQCRERCGDAHRRRSKSSRSRCSPSISSRLLADLRPPEEVPQDMELDDVDRAAWVVGHPRRLV